MIKYLFVCMLICVSTATKASFFDNHVSQEESVLALVKCAEQAKLLEPTIEFEKESIRVSGAYSKTSDSLHKKVYRFEKSYYDGALSRALTVSVSISQNKSQKPSFTWSCDYSSW